MKWINYKQNKEATLKSVLNVARKWKECSAFKKQKQEANTFLNSNGSSRNSYWKCLNRYEGKKKSSVKVGMWSQPRKSLKVEKKKDKEMENKRWIRKLEN